jgi:3-hydroxyacyl-[acyl-carrier-protein] dehydratase
MAPRIQRRWPDKLSATIEIEPSEPVLEGHFPGFAIFPGVCLVECAHRTALLALAECGAPGTRTRLAACETVRFLHPVYPGDRILVEVSVLPLDEGWRCRTRVLVYPRGAAGEPVEAATAKLRYRCEVPAR